MIPEKEGAFSWNHVRGTLGDIVQGRIKGRENRDEITLFKSVGHSIPDITTGQFVYCSYRRSAFFCVPSARA